MSNKINCLLLVLAVVATQGLSLASRCKKHISRSYDVHPYFRLDDENLRYMKKGPNGSLEMHFSIQGPSDGHIILSPTLNPAEETDPAYEIVIGSQSNNLTELRRARHGPEVISIDTPNILSATELRSFYIKIWEDGMIEVGKEGSSPIIQYLDSNPLDIKYFGFSSWEDYEVNFQYDCPKPSEDNKVASRCKKHISRSYDVHPYFRLDDENLRHMKKGPNGSLEMHFSIQGPSDGHIILSPTFNPAEQTDPAYEIVFGSHSNNLTELRRARQGPEISSIDTPNILSATELRSFYIKIWEDGMIEVGKEGSSPIIQSLDSNPLDIKFFGFSSWEDYEVNFLYDCPKPGSEDKQGL